MAFIKEMNFKVSSVIVNLDASGLPDGAPERTEIAVQGFYKIGEDAFEIDYTENTEGGRVVTSISVDGEGVRVLRRGAVDSDMRFSEGASHSSLYTVSPYSFDTVVRCKKIRSTLGKSGGRLDIFYDMTIGGAEKSVRMRIDCAPSEEN